MRTPARPCLEIQDKRGKWLHLTKILGSALVILMSAFSNPSNADAADHEQENDRELWINFGMYSLHGKEEVDLNYSNFGFGVEYQFTETQSLTAGTFKNSDFEQSRYLGWYWLPLALGPVRFGGTFGIMDGYSKARNGKFFPAVLPAISYKQSRLGVNIYPIPGFSDNLYTAISIQVKIRID